MLDKKWKELISGSDIRGVAIDGIEGEMVNLTEDIVQAISCCFGLWLAEKKGKDASELKVSIGMDSRISGPKLKTAAIQGLCRLGCTVYDFGIASTPSMFMSTVLDGYKYDGAIMVTASHLPFNRNGLKFFTSEGGLEKADIADILKKAQQGQYEKFHSEGKVIRQDFISVYSQGLVDKIRQEVNNMDNDEKPLKSFKIIVDAGNGAGGFFAEKVLLPLGANIEGSQYIQPDGYFPNHIPNPEDEDAVESIKQAVLENQADLGIIFDADVDRAGVVFSDGREVNRNRLIALMSAIVLEDYPGSTVVTDSITSTGLKKFIEDKLGGKHHRFKRGYRNVINEALRLNSEGEECHLAIETSGHGALKENYFLDDGAYLVTKILIKMAKLKMQDGKGIESLIDGLEEPIESDEFRMKILQKDHKRYGNRVISELEQYVARCDGWDVLPDNYEGIRVSCDKDNGDGWFLLRLSLHDPILPLNIESDSSGGIKIIVSKLYEFLSGFEQLDITSLKEYL
ncbi:MAG: phosphomannomutase/phosphoglucomutase [Clostridia bacterium]|nr:phosphomannomutase/phosphoglucomutase [Clostridia bacterium]